MNSVVLSAALATIAVASHGDCQQPLRPAAPDSLPALRIAIDEYTPVSAAQRSYAQLRSITAAWRTVTRETVPCVGGHCLVLSQSAWRSVGSPGPGAGRLHVAPYVVELRQPPHHEYTRLAEQERAGVVFERRIGWVPVAQAVGGRDSIEHWIARAAANAVYECSEDDQCRAIRFAVPSGRASVPADVDLESRLVRGRDVTVADTAIVGGGRMAVADTLRENERRIETLTDTLLVDCRVARIGSTVGVPRECVHVATVSGGESWIRVTVGTFGNGNVERVVARFDTVVKRLPSAVDPPGIPLDVAALRAAVAAALGAHPLALQTSMHAQRVLGVGSYRTSDVIPKPPPWREILDVDVEVDTDHQTNDVSFFVQIHADVNPQNTPDGYGRTTGAQSRAYQTAVGDALKRAVASMCARGTWRDSWTYRCAVPVQ